MGHSKSKSYNDIDQTISKPIPWQQLLKRGSNIDVGFITAIIVKNKENYFQIAYILPRNGVWEIWIDHWMTHLDNIPKCPKHFNIYIPWYAEWLKKWHPHNQNLTLIAKSSPLLSPFNTKTLKYTQFDIEDKPAQGAYAMFGAISHNNTYLANECYREILQFVPNQTRLQRISIGLKEARKRLLIKDKERNLLYIFDSITDPLTVIDLATLQRTEQLCFDEERKENYEEYWYAASQRNWERLYPLGCYIPSPIDELHIITNANNRSYHMKLDKKNKKWIKLKGVDYNRRIGHSRMFWIESKQQLMIFGGIKGYYGYKPSPKMSDKIWYCKINENEIDRRYEWSLYHLRMPYRSHRCDIVQIFDGILIVFYFQFKQNKEIWFLNLWNNKWYKSNKHFPFELECGCGYVVKSNDGFVACFSAEFEFHIEIAINDIIPKDLKRDYCKHIGKLITGYAYVNELRVDIPMDILNLIFRFYNGLTNV